MYKIFETIVDNIGVNPEGQMPGITETGSNQPDYLLYIFILLAISTVILFFIFLILVSIDNRIRRQR